MPHQGSTWRWVSVVLMVLVVVLIIALGYLYSSYNSLKSTYSELMNRYNELYGNYTSLRSNYYSLVSQYNSTLIKYSSILSLIGNCKSPLNDELDSDYATGCVLVVPPGYSATVTITASSSSEPIDAYVLTVFWQYAYWAESNWNPSSYIYHGSGMGIETTLSLNPGYYVLIIQNTNSQSTYVTFSMTTTYTS